MFISFLSNVWVKFQSFVISNFENVYFWKYTQISNKSAKERLAPNN